MTAAPQTPACKPTGQRGWHWLESVVRRVWCFVTGHPCEPTGRHAILLREWRCKRCGGLYISHAEYGNCLLPADSGSDRILRDCMDAIKASEATPNGDISGGGKGT
jgi:hypothetical protein